ncbi:MAG: SpoVG family protein [Planctomycetota bacterium]|nr:SpoVG family protein [Planctomycetota bacterium]
MEITEIKVKLARSSGDEKLLAFASITFDHSFVIRDIKVIAGNKGLFVAMPSRKMTDRCPRCGCKNHLRSNYCNECGNRLPPFRAPLDERGRARLHMDIAHPINSRCRQAVQQAIVKAYKEELARWQAAAGRPAEAEVEFDAGPEGGIAPDEIEEEESAAAEEGGGEKG